MKKTLAKAPRAAAPINIAALESAFRAFLPNVTIFSKDEGRTRIDLYDAQDYFLRELFTGLREDVHWFVCAKGRQLGICLDPTTRVLTSDLQWIPMSKLDIGQEIISVDEHSEGPRCGRKMRAGTVTGIVHVRRPAYRITFDSGAALICTGQHPWLSRKKDTSWFWRSIEEPFRDLNRGNSQGVLEIGTQIRWACLPWGESTVEDGWFGGMLDGEGHISNENRSGVQISVSQLKGEVWDRLIAYCKNNNYHYWVQEDNQPCRESKFGKQPVPQIEIRRIDEAFRLIGQTRPTRFLKRRFWNGRELPGKRNADDVGFATITAIDFIGEQDLIDLQTSRGTYIAEGFVSHNTTICLLLDCFWCGAIPDVQGAIVFDSQQNKEKFRILLKDMLDHLPPRHKLPIKDFNRDFLVFKNGNVLDFLTAGVKKGQGTLGRSRALNFVHATECCSYGDPDALEAFKDTLSDIFPARLYMFESTARGPNLFMDLWDEAGDDPITRRQIFLGWWRKDTNRYRVGSPLFERYGYPERTKEEQEAEAEVLRLYGVQLSLEQWAWFRHRSDPRAASDWNADENATRMEVVHEEHPTCVVGETLIGTNGGLIPIADAWHQDEATFGHIGKSGQTGDTDVFKLTTEKGYSLTGTFNHPVKLANDERRFVNLIDAKDTIVLLHPPLLSNRNSIVEWMEGPVHCKITVNIELAQFLGLFMGDGSLHNHTLSIVCTKEDTKVVDHCLYLIRFLFGLDASTRTIGRKQGGTEVRVSSRSFTPLFTRLGLIGSYEYGGLRRIVHVPDYIKRAMPHIIAAFLQGLFEADGWIGYAHTRITLASRYRKFVEDIQLLLLAFGITSTIREKLYKQKHIGFVLDLKANESLKFVNEIGFLSDRKINRSSLWSQSAVAIAKRTPLILQDRVVSIEPMGKAPIFNMNITNGQNLFDANGIVTHNTPESLFRQTGSVFISGAVLKRSAEEAAKHPFKGYRYYIGEDLGAVRLEPLPAAFRNQIQLRIWEEPQPGARYILAADPAYASGDESDFYVIQIMRVYADRVIQVAEFAERNMLDYQFAWVMAHLANHYGRCRIILDVNGPGQAVLGEFRHLRIMLEGGMLDVQKPPDELTNEDIEQNRHFRNFFAGVRDYMYHRFDSFGSGYNIQWKSTVELQSSMWAQFRDQYMMGALEIYSHECLAQMRRLVQEGMFVTAEGKAKKDRAVAAAMAVRCWIDWERRELMAEGRTFESENANPQTEEIHSVGQYMQAQFRDSMAMKQRNRQQVAKLMARPAWKAGVWGRRSGRS